MVEGSGQAGSPMADTYQRPTGKPYTGRHMTVTFDAARCQHAAECLRGLPAVFDFGARPWVRPDGADPESVAEVVSRCPSGALQYVMADGEVEQGLEPTAIRRSPAGRLYVRGTFVLHRGGRSVIETRAILCGCGASGNQPFCDRSAACGDEPVRRFTD